MKRYHLLIIMICPLFLFSQEKVGINTLDPMALLDIYGQGDGLEMLRLSTERPWVFKQTNSGINTKLTLQSLVNDKSFEIVSEDGSNRAMDILTNNIYSKVLMVPDSGSVGVAVENPASKVHIASNSTIGFAQLQLTENENDFARLRYNNTSNLGTFWDIAALPHVDPLNSRLNFYYSGTGSSGDRLTIRGDGNVGIGIFTPTERLDVNGKIKSRDLVGVGDRNVFVDADGTLKAGATARTLNVPASALLPSISDFKFTRDSKAIYVLDDVVGKFYYPIQLKANSKLLNYSIIAQDNSTTSNIRVELNESYDFGTDVSVINGISSTGNPGLVFLTVDFLPIDLLADHTYWLTVKSIGNWNGANLKVSSIKLLFSEP